MKLDCRDLERVLREAESELMAAFQEHAGGCPACGEELRIWKEISAAAPALRKTWQSPALWQRIERALAAEQERASRRWWRRFQLPAGWAFRWQPALAMLVLLVVSGAGVFWVLQNLAPTSPVEQTLREQEERELLTERALREVERKEAEYISSIEELSRLAEPQLRQAETPLLMSYREKLLVLDMAIAELRAQVEQNRFNTHLRTEMLSLYTEKQRTLESALRER